MSMELLVRHVGSHAGGLNPKWFAKQPEALPGRWGVPGLARFAGRSCAPTPRPRPRRRRSGPTPASRKSRSSRRAHDGRSTRHHGLLEVDRRTYNRKVVDLDSSSPAAIRFDPADPEYIRNPYPTYRLLRERAPAYYWSEGKAWIFSRYPDVVAILRDNRFSLDVQQWEHAQIRSQTDTSEFERLTARALFTLPPADHTRVRKLAGKAFTPRALERIRGEVQAIVDDTLADVDECAVFNLEGDFAKAIPVRAIGAMLGVPSSDADLFHRFGESVSDTARPGIGNEERERLLAPFDDGLALLCR